MKKIANVNERMTNFLEGRDMVRKSNQYQPSITMGPANVTNTIDAPNGELWYYTGDFTYQHIKHEYYIEQVLTEYEFKIYDANLTLVGVVHDKMRYQDDEVRVPLVELVPAVTRNFFNNDDKYEIMVGLAVNSTTPGTNHYRTLVYSIGGEKETLPVADPSNTTQSAVHPTQTIDKEFDKPIFRLDGTIGDILDASKDGEENYIISTYGETLPGDDVMSGDIEDPEWGNKFWAALSSSHITVYTYGKSKDNKTLTLIKEVEIPILSMPGDQESTPFMISYNKNGESYLLYQQYKKLYYKPYYRYDEDLEMEDNNSLLIQIYKLKGDEMILDQVTEIPVLKDNVDGCLASYYGVGDMRYTEDISYGQYTDDGKASFMVTRKNYLAGSDDTDQSYFVYDPTGARIRTIYEYADAHFPVSNLDGFEPQEVFTTIEGGQYVYYMVDLVSGKKALRLPSYLMIDDDSEPDLMAANMDRVEAGDSYKYAIEMRYPIDEDENSILRVAWINRDGSFDQMHEVNIGPAALYAQVYINSDCLNPRLFYGDNKYEYMMLVKRGLAGQKSNEELMICQVRDMDNPQGKEILKLEPNDEKGVLNGILPYAQEKNPVLSVNWLKPDENYEYFYTQDVYFLPFGSSAVEEIATDVASAIYFDGTSVYAPGHDIKIYSLQGMIVAEGHDSVGTSILASGIYIATANGQARKFYVK